MRPGSRMASAGSVRLRVLRGLVRLGLAELVSGETSGRGHVVLVRITEAGRKAARVLPPAAAWEIVEDPIGQEHGQDPIGERHGGLSQAGPTARCCGRGPLAGLAEASVFIKSLKRKGLRSGEKFT